MLEHGFAQMDKTFADQFAAARSTLGISQERLSAEMARRGYPIHVTAIGKIEKGSRKVSVGEAAAIADVLGLPLDLLLGGETTLRSAYAAHDRTFDALTAAVEADVRALLDVVVAADTIADGLGPSEVSWLESEHGLLAQTPVKVAADALEELDAQLVRQGLPATGRWVAHLRKLLKADAESVRGALSDG